MTNNEPSPVAKMQTLETVGNTPQPLQTPNIHTVVQTKDTEADSVMKEYMAFKEYLEAQRKYKEKADGKKVTEDELDRISVCRFSKIVID